MWWLIPIGIGVIIGIALTKKGNRLEGIPIENQIDQAINLDEVDLSNAKRKITRFINDLINRNEVKGFKIGKTGQSKKRAWNYEGYKYIFILGKSEDKELINELEAHYIDKYFTNPKNDNENKGSAGDMQTEDGYYYLYIVVR